MSPLDSMRRLSDSSRVLLFLSLILAGMRYLCGSLSTPTPRHACGSPITGCTCLPQRFPFPNQALAYGSLGTGACALATSNDHHMSHSALAAELQQRTGEMAGGEGGASVRRTSTSTSTSSNRNPGGDGSGEMDQQKYIPT